MIVSFPDPYSDEILINIGGRFQGRFMFPNEGSAVREFFGHGLVKVVADLPSHIDGLVSQLPSGHTYTSDQFIERNTLFPLYRWFLPEDRVEAIRSNMKVDQGKDLHILAGITACRISLPQHFMSCPSCVKQERNGPNKECYFHRSHHAPGVKICAEHQVWLETTSRQTTARREFVSAERIVEDQQSRPIDISNLRDKALLRIAIDVHWLLNANIQPCHYSDIRQRYIRHFITGGYASHSGHVRSKKLTTDLREFYGDALLEELDCGLVGMHARNWLARITQAGQVQHPLRHLLLIQFLGVTAEAFFTLRTDDPPFGKGPWPCLNPICTDYHQPVIQSLFLGHSRTLNRNPVGTFICPTCGFTYVRTGPDEKPEDTFRGKTLSYGALWDQLLTSLWNDKTLLKKDIAIKLGVGQDTLIRQVRRLELLDSLPKKQTDNHSMPKSSIQQTIAEYRQKWLIILTENPDTCITDLWQKYPEECRVLDRRDHDWFMSHQPARRSGDTSPIVDWLARDQWLASVAPTVVQRILNRTGKRAERITLNAIAREIQWGEGSLQRDGEKLPTAINIITPLLETHEDFAMRRIIYTNRYFEGQQVVPGLHQFLKKAGLNPEVRTERVLKAVHDAINQLRNHAKIGE